MRALLRRAYHLAIHLLYGRRDFKLLLRTSIGEIDAALRAQAIATDLFSAHLQPVPIRAPFGRSMLVVAPHQDDEMIGCGGAALLQARLGGSVKVVLLQDGGDEHATAGMSREEMTRQRNAES